ncbi:MAG TPA: metal-dependent phosphohydrolase [Planctomycetaceae bacterium]|nr:metal-dependent phosphohydrolase [Planctomycetaceae bacterium]
MIELPEIAALRCSRGILRIPPELDVPVTPRVKRLIDTAAFRRLARISQLGLVGLVYPAANHTRFEHSLGVYRMALLFLDRLGEDSQFVALVEPHDAERFLVTALLHDLGHWPFCHPLEDMGLDNLPSHEQFAKHFILEREIAQLLERDWQLDPVEIVSMLSEKLLDPTGKLLQSLLSGPIDVDKMDYLMRDSLHAGVPYGRNFDQSRLIQSLCLNQQGTKLAISDKGKTAAEMMVFARYVMFSEVYWHHAVRSATAMLQRAFFLIQETLDHKWLFCLTERPMIEAMQDAAGQGPVAGLLSGLFGSHRILYKRVAQFSLFEEPDLYRALARKPYPWLVRCATNFAEIASRSLAKPIAPEEVLFDAPPPELEVEFQMDVHFGKEDCYRPLGEISPVVSTLAREQFDDYVKRVRVFVHPQHAELLRQKEDMTSLLSEAIAITG